jgi:hypothetical protein
MADAGWPYAPVDPDDIVVTPDERGPGWGVAQSLLNAVDGMSAGLTTQNAADRAGIARSDQEDWFGQVAECSNSAAQETESRVASVGAASARLEAAWDEFYATDDYSAATAAWSDCMSDSGYSYSNPDEVLTELREQMRTLVDGAGGDPAELSRSQILELQRAEVELFEVDTTCRSETLDPVELAFKTELFANETAAIDAIRRATRGDE